MTREIVIAQAKQEAERVYELNNHSDRLTTSDATPEVIVTVEIEDNTAGLAEVELIAIVVDASAKYTGKWLVGFLKSTTLTIDVETTLHAQNGIAGASIDFTNESENLGVEITGVAATDINWLVRVKQISLTAISGA